MSTSHPANSEPTNSEPTNSEPTNSEPTNSEPTPYERMGGHEAFTRLVDRFYEGVAGDPELRAMYPEADLAPAARRLRMFLEQYWGGPRTYQEERGHPRLRMRHVAFAVTPHMRDRWLAHMLAAVDDLALPPAEDAELREYLIRAADFLVNQPDSAPR